MGLVGCFVGGSSLILLIGGSLSFLLLFFIHSWFILVGCFVCWLCFGVG